MLRSTGHRPSKVFELALWKEQHGFYLLDFLAAVALTGMVGLTVLSIMLHTMSTRSRLQNQTKQYEAIRIPAQMIIQDARIAKQMSGDPTKICLYNKKPDGSELVKPSDPDDPYAPPPYYKCDDGVLYFFNSKGLQRQVWKDGVMLSEQKELVAERSDITGKFTVLAAELVDDAKVRLEAPALRGQTQGVFLEFQIYTRDQE